MDIRLHYVEKGAGEALILLHGNGEDGTYFVHQMEALSGRFRVIAVDTRGHGKSPRGSAPFTIAQFAEDLKDFMDGLGLEKAHLLGFSDGANIALAFAMKYPQRVDRLVLNGGNLFPGGVKRSVQRPIEIGWRLTKWISKFDKKARAKFELLDLMVTQPNVAPEDLARLNVPTLMIAGTDDMIEEKHTRLIRDSIPGSTLSFIMGDHFVANKNPEPFNRAVYNFLIPEEERPKCIPTR